ncbi:alpha/beta hydrolase [Caminibacter mediatlanticus]|uniref:alpha/beta hydrolase n=1 Tax=Caminibacter mediatlanticus TaxID=291048 RepID=UPI0030C85AD9
MLLEGGYVENKKDAKVVLYFGGNSNNVLEFLENIATQIKDFNFIAFNYPGYGNSQGLPSEEKILKYSIEIFDKYKPQIIIGRSLGTAVASYAASKRDIEKLILITPFDSIENIAKSKYSFLPVKYILKHKFKEIDWIKKVKTHVYVILSEIENIVPKKSLKSILSNIPNLKNFYIIKNSTHGNILQNEDFVNILEKILKH